MTLADIHQSPLAPYISPQVASSSIITLTPALAEALLKVNTANRRMRRSRVQAYAAAIRRGEWVVNGEGISISSDGRLLNGQHRCAAVVMTGISIQTLLVTGLDPAVFDTIDGGGKRTTADVMQIKGEGSPAATAAIARLLCLYIATGDPYNSNPAIAPSSRQLLDLVQQHPRLRETTRWVDSTRWCKKYMHPSVAGFCHYMFSGVDASATKQFFGMLESGAGLEKSSPILQLRNRLTETAAGKTSTDMALRCMLTFKAFRLYRDGSTIANLRVRLGGNAPEIAPYAL